MNGLKQNPKHFGIISTNKKTSVFTRESTTGPDKQQTGSIIIESPRGETAHLNRMTSEEIIPLDIPSPENISPSHRRNIPGLISNGDTPVHIQTMRDTYRHLLSNREPTNRSKPPEYDPRIIVTPVADEFEPLNSPALSARSSPFSPKKESVAQQLSFFLKKKLVGSSPEMSSVDSRQTIEDPLRRRKTLAVNRLKGTRDASGRLLSIMAKQAVSRNSDVSKIFAGALEKLNSEALKKARKEQSLNKRKRIIRFFRRAKGNLSLIFEPWKPDSLPVILWKILTLFVILMQAVLSTYIVTFLPSSQANLNNTIFKIDFIADILYFIEILSMFQIEYYYHGELHKERRDIVIHYLTTKFWLDITTELSFIGRFFPYSSAQNLMLLTVLRIYKIPSLLSAIIDYFQFSREITTLLRVVRLSVLTCMLAHFFSCGLYAITKWESDGETWVSSAGLDDAPEYIIYVASLYWSVTTMSTTGFGDIAPKTVAERIFLVVVMILSSIVFGYILSTIGALLLEMSAHSSEAREKIRILTKYMNEKGLNKNTQSKIRKYLEFYLDRENTARIEVTDFIMKMLSPNLQDEIVREVNAKIMSDTEIFSSNFRRRFLYIVSKDLVERSFGPEETIYDSDHEGCSVYFITSGKVDICYERCGVSLEKLKKKGCFGYVGFFSGEPREYNAKSLEFSTVFELTRRQFLHKLEGFPTEKETYFMIKDSINLYENYKYVGLKCYSCKSTKHTIFQCPNLFVTVDRQEAIQKYLVKDKEFRETYTRRSRPKFHSLRNLDQLQEAASQIQISHQNEQYQELDVEEDFVVEGGYYSSVDEILDRKIYDPKPLDYVADTVHMKYLDLGDVYKNNNASLLSVNQIPGSKRQKHKIGETELFMRGNYDLYYHNLNLDRVKNFEVYYPNNNITKLMIEFEKTRLEKIVQMRLGLKAKHISPLLVKSFKMYERRDAVFRKQTPPANQLLEPAPKTFAKRHSIAGNLMARRDSLRSKPGDIVLYQTGTSASNTPKPSKYKIDSNKSSPVSSPYLAATKETLKKFNPIEFAKRLGRSKDLTIIKEANTEKLERERSVEKGPEGPASLVRLNSPDSKQSKNLSSNPLDASLDFNSFINEIKKPGMSSSNSRTATPPLLRPKRASKIEGEDPRDSNSSDSSVGGEPLSGGGEIGDYSKLVQTFPETSKLFPTKYTLKTEAIEKENLLERERSDNEARLVKMLVHERLKTEGSQKTRAASEDRGKDAKKVMERYQLPQLFKKLRDFDHD